MAKVDPYPTVTPEKGQPGHRDVYHDRSECPDGCRIESGNRRGRASKVRLVQSSVVRWHSQLCVSMLVPEASPSHALEVRIVGTEHRLWACTHPLSVGPLPRPGSHQLLLLGLPDGIRTRNRICPPRGTPGRPSARQEPSDHGISRSPQAFGRDIRLAHVSGPATLTLGPHAAGRPHQARCALSNGVSWPTYDLALHLVVKMQ